MKHIWGRARNCRGRGYSLLRIGQRSTLSAVSTPHTTFTSAMVGGAISQTAHRSSDSSRRNPVATGIGAGRNTRLGVMDGEDSG